MKKIIVKCLVITLVVACLATALVGCKKPDPFADLSNLGTLDYKSYEEASGVDSIAAFNSAMEYFKNSKKYTYTILFQFATKPALATQVNREVIKRDGDKVWHEQISIGTGMGEAHNALIRYFDGDKKLKVGVVDDKKRVPGYNNAEKLEQLNYNLEGVAPVAIDGEMPDFEYCKQFANYAEYMYRRATEYLWFYNTNPSDLAQEHSSKVYTDGKFYYCDIIIDTKKCVKEGNQPDIIKDLEIGIGMPVIKFNENTVFKMKLEKVGNGYRFISTHMTENYKASLASAEQTMQRLYSYSDSDAKITSKDIELFK